MDYSQMPLGLGFAMFENQMEMDRFSNMTDDEKREYIERNRSVLSERTINKMMESIVDDKDDVPDLDKSSGLFNDRSIG